MGGERKSAAKIFNIPAGADFSSILAQTLLLESQARPEELTRYRILLPTRRACRVLRDSFLDLSDGRPVLLPQMNPIGDVDEEDLGLVMFGASEEEFTIPVSMPSLRRQILLARIIMKIPDFAQGFDHALVLAKALGQLIDKTATEELSLQDLWKIVPHEFAGHWQITLRFLEIISTQWPQILSENKACDAATRRNLLLHALANFWEKNPPDAPVIVAGSTGSLPATGNLIRVISTLPQGRVFLPGLDSGMDQESWDILEESHPQYGLKKLLERLDIKREEVQPIDTKVSPRIALAAEMMRPAQTTHHWRTFASSFDFMQMLDGLRYYECKTQQEEAQLIALLVRGGVENQGKTVALICPDRDLAARVIALCRRWGIEADDSAGMSLRRSRIGQFIALSLGVVAQGFQAPALCAFLKHTLCHMGISSDLYRKFVRDLEKEILRGQDVVFNLERLEELCASHSSELHGFCEIVVKLIRPMFEMAELRRSVAFHDLLKAHLAMIEAFAASDSENGEDLLWRGDDGETASLFFSDVMRHGEEIGSVSIKEYEKIILQLMEQVSIRTPYGVHPRFAVLGQLEARLTSADLIIMSGLNEGSWPSAEKHDPWMSRKMRQDFGLPTEEKSVGLAAHDFVQGFCASQVVLTRSQQVGGAPCVTSRWLQRLDTVLTGAGLGLKGLNSDSYLQWVRAMDRVETVQPFERPKPCPPLSVRPSKVSVTKIENWLSDPYGIYAYYVLRLRPLNSLKREMDAALNGTVYHAIFQRFKERYPAACPDEAMAEMIAIAQDVLAGYGIEDDQLNFWWSRFLRGAQWFVDHEKEWCLDAKYKISEVKGSVDFDIEGRRFTIEGRADRIDLRHGGYALIDYKTSGRYASFGSALKKGALPQLPLEAMMAARGGFEGVPAVPVNYLGYWVATGGREAGAEAGIFGEEVDQAVQLTQEGVVSLLAHFMKKDSAFICIPDLNNPPEYNDFEHLSRLKEWAILDDRPMAGEGEE